jgi:hypothetical protein
MMTNSLQNLTTSKPPSEVNPEAIKLEKKKVQDAIEILMAYFVDNKDNYLKFKEGYETMAFFDNTESKKVVVAFVSQFLDRYETFLKERTHAKNAKFDLQKKLILNVLETVDTPNIQFDRDFLLFMIGFFTKILEKNYTTSFDKKYD